MMYNTSEFCFNPPAALSFARRILIKPDAAYPLPYPHTTSRDILARVVSCIRRVSDADIVILECNPDGEAMRPIYNALGYDFPRVVMMDVRDCVMVEVENPLSKPFAMTTFWVPNVLLACDYLISVAPFKVRGGHGCFALRNLLGLLPMAKYRATGIRNPLERFHSDLVVADLYYTIPFDLGIVDARQLFVEEEPGHEKVENFGKIFLGDPRDVDAEASSVAGTDMGYLRMIQAAHADQKI